MSTNEEKDTSLTLSETDEQLPNPIGELEPKQQRFVHLFLTGQYSMSKLAQLLDVHPNTLYNWSRRPDVKNAIADMQTVTHEVIASEMKAMTAKAMTRMRELMDSPIDGVALQAVKDVLDRTGHKPKQEVTKNINVRSFEEKLNDIIDATIDDEIEEAEWEEAE